MKNIAYTIEDLLEITAGLKKAPKINIDSSDATIMYSIARQVFKGTPLTDRQYSLMKEKLSKYKDQFISLECNFDLALDTLRNPLRHIDRSKYIKIVDTAEVYADRVYESYKQNWKWMKIRFPFSKKLIGSVQKFVILNNYQHKKGSHEHYVSLTEENVYQVISEFKDKNFEIEKDLIDIYNACIEVKENVTDYVCSIKNNKFYNFNPKLEKLLLDTIGPIEGNELVYKDRSRRYNFLYLDEIDFPNNIIDSIINNNAYDKLINFRTKDYTTKEVFNSLIELKRFPLLVVLNTKTADFELKEYHDLFGSHIPSNLQSVLFRLSNDDSNGSRFNNYIKDNNLNNMVDKNTKVVYISNEKLPKPLVSSGWNPITVFTKESSRIDTNIVNFARTTADIVISNDDIPFTRMAANRWTN